jgi:hypothetical protein
MIAKGRLNEKKDGGREDRGQCGKEGNEMVETESFRVSNQVPGTLLLLLIFCGSIEGMHGDGRRKKTIGIATGGHTVLKKLCVEPKERANVRKISEVCGFG